MNAILDSEYCKVVGTVAKCMNTQYQFLRWNIAKIMSSGNSIYFSVVALPFL